MGRKCCRRGPAGKWCRFLDTTASSASRESRSATRRETSNVDLSSTRVTTVEPWMRVLAGDCGDVGLVGAAEPTELTLSARIIDDCDTCVSSSTHFVFSD